MSGMEITYQNKKKETQIIYGETVASMMREKIYKINKYYFVEINDTTICTLKNYDNLSLKRVLMTGLSRLTIDTAIQWKVFKN